MQDVKTENVLKIKLILINKLKGIKFYKIP